jgi:EAL domain-containing protein (putative c-di-GMP-specific phosphodiesterase class I)
VEATTEHNAAHASDWSVALQQVFAEPWRIRPAYQPIVDLERRAVWGFQVLARFISPRRATPPEWLDAAGALGLREALESRLLMAGIQARDEVPDRCRLLLPVSAESLVSPSFQKAFAKHLRVARHLLLDLAPGGEDVDVAVLAEAAALLRRDGGGLALMAGASPGGLDALPRLRPEVLKLGRDYVAGVEDDAARRAVVEGLGELVGALGGRLLAVGIESRPQLEALEQAGISLGQGFGLGRPVPSMALSVTRASAPLLNA